jgi:hypothetical protein
MLGVALADDAGHAVALHDLAVFANRLDAAADFHGALQIENRTISAKTLRIVGLGVGCKGP